MDETQSSIRCGHQPPVHTQYRRQPSPPLITDFSCRHSIINTYEISTSIVSAGARKEKIFLRVENNSLALRVPAPACLPSPPGRWDQSKVVKWTKLEIVP